MIRGLLFLVLTVLLSSCLSMAWKGYREPSSTDYVTVGCMQIGRQNLNEHQWQAIKEASTDVCAIFSDPEFKSKLISQNWLASCGRKHGRGDSISGVEVFEMIRHKVFAYSIYPHKPWNAEAQTETNESAAGNRVAIDPAIIAKWFAQSDTAKGNLINVIAHETIHIISDRFLDYDGHASARCPDAVLVSYAVGDVIEAIWLKHHRK